MMLSLLRAHCRMSCGASQVGGDFTADDIMSVPKSNANEPIPPDMYANGGTVPSPLLEDRL